ncbi:hypothetical protein PF008_g16701 [Phytophthora fragariae]|uniref:Amino acid transporter n=1 Tax=Phytophthora fragariae TaxID=53985 RepID=A0A6G0RAW2_9STRA|nr:hypothetical protein PF008_g16701 [Phytophthora fragariae]
MGSITTRPPVQPSLSYESIATPPSSEAGRDTFSSVETRRQPDEEPASPPSQLEKWLCGLRGVVLGVVVGIVLGLVLNAVNLPGAAATWIGTPGRLFIRALECLVPLLVFSGLVVSMTIADSEDLRVLLRSVAMYCLCVICGLGVHVLVFYPLLLRTFIRNANPFDWLAKMVRAQLFALANFIASCCRWASQLGVDGAAVGTPIAVVFMAQVSGVSIDPADYLAIWLASAVGSIGVGPVPSTGLVLIMTVWKTVFPSEALPAGFAFIIATDWLIDRLHTVVNVTCDTVVCRVVAHLVCDPCEKLQEEGELPRAQIPL